MPEVCDYSIIINKRHDLREIKVDFIPQLEFIFETGGREPREALLLIATHGPVDRDVDIRVNGSKVGSLAKNLNAAGSATQVFLLPSNLLKDGKSNFKSDGIGFIAESVIWFFWQTA